MRKRFSGVAVLIIGTTLASKLLGFLRESSIASCFGVNSNVDAYVISVTVYTMIFLMFSESINNAFLPAYLKLSKKDKQQSEAFAGSLMVLITAATAGITIVGEIFPEAIIRAVAPGFNPDVAALAQKLIRITIPVIIVTGISILATGILQSRERFFPQAFMGIPNHIMVITILAAFGSRLGITGLTIITALGTFLQLFMQLPYLVHEKIKFHFSFKFNTAEHKVFFASIVPVFIATSARQINTMIDRALASGTGAGNISILNYANILNISVIGLFVTTITTILFPRLAADDDNSTESGVLEKSINIVMAVTIPVTIIVCVYRYEIVAIMFQRGNFTRNNAAATSVVFMLYSLSLVPFAINDVLTKRLYALNKSRIPMIGGIIAVGINIILNLLLINPMGIRGLALSTSISSVISAVFIILYMREHKLLDINKLANRAGGFIPPGLLMLVITLVGRVVLKELVPIEGLPGMMIVTGIPVMLGMCVYLIGVRNKKLQNARD